MSSSSSRLFTRSYTCILSANFLLYFGFWLLIPLLPFYLKENYGLGESVIGIILSCYTVSALTVRPFSGYLLEKFARKPLYILAYAVFTCLFGGYIVGGTLTAFVLLRVAHGLAFGTVTVGGNTLVVDIMPSARRGEGLGYYGLANNIAMSVGPMTGLALHGHIPYEAIFAIAMGSCAIGLALALCVKAPMSKKKTETAQRMSAVGLDRFILLKGIPASIALLLLSIPYGATTNFVAMYVEQIGLQVPSSLFFVLLATGMGISRLFAGKFVDRGYVTECIHYGFYMVIAAFLLLSACKFLVNTGQLPATIGFLVVPFLQGVGFGVMFPAYNSLYINLGRHDQRATATSTYLTSWDLGIGIGFVVAGIIAEHFSFAAVYFIGAVFSTVSMLYFNLIVTPHYRANISDDAPRPQKRLNDRLKQ